MHRGDSYDQIATRNRMTNSNSFGSARVFEELDDREKRYSICFEFGSDSEMRRVEKVFASLESWRVTSAPSTKIAMLRGTKANGFPSKNGTVVIGKLQRSLREQLIFVGHLNGYLIACT